MPEMSSIASFIKAVHDRRTTVSAAIKQLWDDRESDQKVHDIVDELDTISLDPVDPRIRAALIARGLRNAHVDHLDSWPPVEKEAVRTALQSARDNGQSVDFLWELYDGAASHTHVQSRPASNEVDIIFQSPRQNVRKGGATYGQIHVDI